MLHAVKQRNVTAIERLAQTPFGPELLMARDATTWQTALQLACSPGASQVVQVLLQASADVSAREPSRSWTALHVAADRGCDVPTLQMLLEVGLDPLRCASDTAGSSAADIVRAKNKHDTARFLDTWQPVQEQDESLDTPATPPETKSPKDHEQEIELLNPSSNTNATKGDEERLLREEISELKSIVKLETAKTKRLRVTNTTTQEQASELTKQLAELSKEKDSLHKLIVVATAFVVGLFAVLWQCLQSGTESG